jgi:hypothetical protein
MSELLRDGAETCRYMRAAVFHLLSCWDALNRAEQATGVCIDVGDIEEIACGLVGPGDAMHADDETVRAWIDAIKQEQEQDHDDDE